ncbi:MAG: 16S rRNA (cytosine(1402)-N(4))-methyltransferase RsmH [Opitutales bacterium]|nr:16S rRNA (cytosine(1402)-N(4))-methyltransferase RsmH [Opitutales bacterium]
MTTATKLQHYPVMLYEVTQVLINNPAGTYLDCTFGGGGHSRHFLEEFPNIQLYAIDRDPDAWKRAEELKREFPRNFFFECMPFSTLDRLGVKVFSGVLFDFGISSIQLDDAERGFSFRYHMPLDMRMNPKQGMSAQEFLKTASREQLIEAICDFGEEAQGRRIVDLILKNRGSEVLEFADTFADLIAQHCPRSGKIHPATKTFQGIRIAVNHELEEIQQALPKAFERLQPGGRLVVLSFHSLEDRIVKQFWRKMETSSRAKSLTPKPILPPPEEVKMNLRSRSAKLRILEKFQ